MKEKHKCREEIEGQVTQDLFQMFECWPVTILVEASLWIPDPPQVKQTSSLIPQSWLLLYDDPENQQATLISPLIPLELPL